MAVAAIGVGAGIPATTGTDSGVIDAGIVVDKVDGLPTDFINGVDVSSVLALEASGVIFRDDAGTPADLFAVLAEHGVTDVRVRVWNDPHDADGQGYGGGTTDAARATEIGRRATDAGLRVLVGFHYSDFWADPAKQRAPKSWEETSDEERAAVAGEFTHQTLTTMKDAGVDVRVVQVGNETNSGVAGVTAWAGIAAIFSAGSAAVRDVYPDAQVAVHFANPEKEGAYARYASILDYFDVDYDVFASSYYPFWHGTTENLTAVLSDIANTYGKQVMVAETSWVRTLEDGDGSPNVVGTADLATAYPVSVQGQATAVPGILVGEDGVATIAVTGTLGGEDWGFIDGFELRPEDA
ncbi:glycosyl hydrolase 53 family protein [Demequina oxidasica]|uniref:glycosyl hydrolase 53 family protein n=1 Tax=Demequina oxidasica TaxID=676199 RepID=UPI000781B994|nr:glycosyl hydrolase 53 family protein [Demequina oxidasica]